MYTQWKLFKQISSSGEDFEHVDFKVRVEEARLDKMKRHLEIHEKLVLNLREAHAAREQEEGEAHELKLSSKNPSFRQGSNVSENPLNSGDSDDETPREGTADLSRDDQMVMAEGDADIDDGVENPRNDVDSDSNEDSVYYVSGEQSSST
jgi:hypothetical protein